MTPTSWKTKNRGNLNQSWNEQAVFDIFAFLKETGFALVNVMDLYYAKDKAVQLIQMDCVFRNIKQIRVI